jgi:hypothetical protein
MPRLKVFRTPIGFYDAYVAAPSQKAALEAWGSEKNLFASGRAELVEDAKLTRAPLAKPGEVIKLRRGTDEENIAALPRTKRAAPKKSAVPAKAARRPSRAALDRAEKALEAAERKREQALGKIDEELRTLQAKRRAEARKQDEAIDRLTARRDEKADAYDAAMAEWRES